MPQHQNLNVVPFVSVENMMNIVTTDGIAETIEGIANYILQDFRKWQSFDKTPRVASHSDVGVIELMPTSDGELYGFKYVNGHPKNMKEGLQTVTAFGVLSEVSSGYPVLLSEMTILTALRTATMSALAARYLAPKNATTMTMIGNGAQSEFQAIAFQKLCGINKLHLFDVDPTATRKCRKNLASLGFEIEVFDTPEDAIRGAQIITTCTADKQNATILTDNMVGSGVHINAVGGDCPGKTELHADILHRSDIYVEYPPQTRIEGEIQQLGEDHPVLEIWRVMADIQPGRTSSNQITLFDSVGFAIEDFSALRFIRDRLSTSDKFEQLDLIADPDDPRDLYGMVVRSKKKGLFDA